MSGLLDKPLTQCQSFNQSEVDAEERGIQVRALVIEKAVLEHEILRVVGATAMGGVTCSKRLATSIQREKTHGTAIL